jgi:hypothetical protein
MEEFLDAIWVDDKEDDDNFSINSYEKLIALSVAAVEGF